MRLVAFEDAERRAKGSSLPLELAHDVLTVQEVINSGSSIASLAVIAAHEVLACTSVTLSVGCTAEVLEAVDLFAVGDFRLRGRGLVLEMSLTHGRKNPLQNNTVRVLTNMASM